MNDNQAEDLFDNVKEVVDTAFGEDVPFLIIIPHNQQMATNISPSGIPPILAAILHSLLAGSAHILEHSDENGNDETSKPAGMN